MGFPNGCDFRPSKSVSELQFGSDVFPVPFRPRLQQAQQEQAAEQANVQLILPKKPWRNKFAVLLEIRFHLTDTFFQQLYYDDSKLSAIPVW